MFDMNSFDQCLNLSVCRKCITYFHDVNCHCTIIFRLCITMTHCLVLNIVSKLWKERCIYTYIHQVS